MTLLDANILVYVYNVDAREHGPVAKWFRAELTAGNSIALSWPVIWAFFRISTNQRAVLHPLSLAQTFEIVRDLLAHPNVHLINAGARHAEILEKLVTDYNIIGSRISDAVLAAIAIEHGASIASTDRDFRRFETLRWINPLTHSK